MEIIFKKLISFPFLLFHFFIFFFSFFFSFSLCLEFSRELTNRIQMFPLFYLLFIPPCKSLSFSTVWSSFQAGFKRVFVKYMDSEVEKDVSISFTKSFTILAAFIMVLTRIFLPSQSVLHVLQKSCTHISNKIYLLISTLRSTETEIRIHLGD